MAPSNEKSPAVVPAYTRPEKLAKASGTAVVPPTASSVHASGARRFWFARLADAIREMEAPSEMATQILPVEIVAERQMTFTFVARVPNRVNVSPNSPRARLYILRPKSVLTTRVSPIAAMALMFLSVFPWKLAISRMERRMPSEGEYAWRTPVDAPVHTVPLWSISTAVRSMLRRPSAFVRLWYRVVPSSHRNSPPLVAAQYVCPSLAIPFTSFIDV